MLKVYDKARWHIDAGADETAVVEKMKVLFDFLNAKGLLKDEGKEVLDLGIDDSVSIHERMLTEEGNKFMESKYDSVINTNMEEFAEALEATFKEFAK